MSLWNYVCRGPFVPTSLHTRKGMPGNELPVGNRRLGSRECGYGVRGQDLRTENGGLRGFRGTHRQNSTPVDEDDRRTSESAWVTRPGGCGTTWWAVND